ncbi:MAG TPA: hypothetical protein VJT74_17440 [Pyrinomonadaceae bacterium]|nr:hypothetical protein [Pyrinomonadaceae bacterium]
MADEKEELVPQKQSLFDVTPDDILDNALRNLDEKQARDVTKKAAGEVVRLAVEKRLAEHRTEAAQEEMRNLVRNADLLDQRGGDYQINSTFETATGTTQVQITKSKSAGGLLIAAAIALVILVIILITLLVRA